MIRQEQCDKVCRILDDVLANRPTERDSLIVAVRKAFDALEKQNTGRWIPVPRYDGDTQPNLKCPFCGNEIGWWDLGRYCAGCGAKLKGLSNGRVLMTITLLRLSMTMKRKSGEIRNEEIEKV